MQGRKSEQRHEKGDDKYRYVILSNMMGVSFAMT